MCRVDLIYAYFCTLKPGLYADFDVSPEERGFIVHNPTDDFEVIENYFTVGPHKMSLDWEVRLARV